jgi:hypothetical protein
MDNGYGDKISKSPFVPWDEFLQIRVSFTFDEPLKGVELLVGLNIHFNRGAAELDIQRFDEFLAELSSALKRLGNLT